MVDELLCQHGPFVIGNAFGGVHYRNKDTL